MPRKIATYRPETTRASARTERTAEALARERFYDRAAWLQLRKWKLARDPLCERCLEKSRASEARHVHHAQTVADRPDLALDPGNLQSLCIACHSSAHVSQTHRPRGG